MGASLLLCGLILGALPPLDAAPPAELRLSLTLVKGGLHLELANRSARPIRILLGGNPFGGAVPFELVIDGRAVPIEVKHNDDGRVVFRTLKPGGHYELDFPPDLVAQFRGKTLVLRYVVHKGDCGDCWMGELASVPLAVPK
jgi:hypothetical protein